MHEYIWLGNKLGFEQYRKQIILQSEILEIFTLSS